MSAQNWLGLILGASGAFGMWVSGTGRWQGWAVGLAIQPVWVAFFLLVGSYTALAVPAMYGSVYARNLWKWRRGRRTFGQRVGSGVLSKEAALRLYPGDDQ